MKIHRTALMIPIIDRDHVAAFQVMLTLSPMTFSVWAHFWPRMTRNGALAGLTVGTITVAIEALLEGGVFEAYEILPGFLVNYVAIVLVSLVGEPPVTEIRQVFAPGLARISQTMGASGL